MLSSPTSLLAIAVTLAQGSGDVLTCTPAGYAQVQQREEYQRVDCVAARPAESECSAQSFPLHTLKAGPNSYTASGTLPTQDEFHGRFKLSVNRRTGAYKFVVIATLYTEPGWSNKKTFWGTCMKGTAPAPF